MDGPGKYYLIFLDTGRMKDFRKYSTASDVGTASKVIRSMPKSGVTPIKQPIAVQWVRWLIPFLPEASRPGSLSGGNPLRGKDDCPVQIDIPRMLLKLRSMLAGKYGVDKSGLGWF